jgi:hypothetical protein
MSSLDWWHPQFLDNIEVSKVKDFFRVEMGGKALTFTTPMLRIPFGLDKNYNNITIKFQCLQEDEDHEDFMDFLKNLEEKISELTGVPRDILPSQISKHPGYPELFNTRVISSSKNGIGTDVVDSDGTPVNIYTLEKGDTCKIKMMVDSIRPYKGKFWYKLKCKKIVCVK